ncbi:flagellar hook capping protein [Erythrobacter sp. SG61-1L]|uniref:flagellar hook assembly protein FlgD n=1 Tax=Erythrobacter sp. SG61-1L TaxID=1603897 RepID=UPI0006C90684|nr:flagellar hook capping FlgD N-terminal domain-containing protein [Erythrobacter sp. SG61-1L]KPL68266.1 flagellar hook capping protein [Erythrobacter sp. SG61-1L]
MASNPIDALGGSATGTSGTQSTQSATDAFGLGFEDLLKIVLTQLTYQDPLKPMDNFQFVSQLAQFSQIQQTQQMSESLQALVSAQSTAQAASLLGRTVEIPAGSVTLSGKVTAIAFSTNGPSLTITTSSNQTISDISLSSVSKIRETN